MKRPQLVPADQTARLLERLEAVRRTYRPENGYCTDTQVEKLPARTPVRYYPLPRSRKQ